MQFEDWKEWIENKDLDSQLLWLIDSYDRYLRENRDKWEALRNTSHLSDNYKEAVDYNNREGDAQRERYEWLLQYISNNYAKKPIGEQNEDLDKCYTTIGTLIEEKTRLEKEMEVLKAKMSALEKSLIFNATHEPAITKDDLYNMGVFGKNEGNSDE